MWFYVALFVFANYAVMSSMATREYSIRRDIIVGVKAPEFSVFDPSGKNLIYRIESKFWGLHKIELVSRPSKQVVGRLTNKITFLLYEANFEILDPTTQQWVPGTIKQNFKILNHRSTIEWNGRRLSMEHNIASLTTRFLDDQQGGNLVGEYKVSLHSLIWATKYSMKIYDDSLPEAIFLFGLAARDYIITNRPKNR